jgi:hypothetical protein
MNGHRMFELLHQDMVLEAPAFGTKARGTLENEKALGQFFAGAPSCRCSSSSRSGKT